MTSAWTRELDEAGVVRLAELLALKLRPAMSIALSGELGAGKTTFARALIRAMLGDAAAEVPSPTFSLRQDYATPRLTVTHFDFYRLGSARGGARARPRGGARDGRRDHRMAGARCRAAARRAASRSRWPRPRMPACGASRCAGMGSARRRAQRIGEMMAFLDGAAGLARRAHRLSAGRCLDPQLCAPLRAHGTVLLMDAPRQPDGPPIRDGMPYSRIAHLAEDVCARSSAIGRRAARRRA